MPGKEFTFEDLVDAPRPQAAIPSPDGVRALAVVDKWDNEAQKNIRTLNLIALTPPAYPLSIPLLTLPAKDAKSFFWLDEETIAYLRRQAVEYFRLPCIRDEAAAELERKALFEFPDGTRAGVLEFHTGTGVLCFKGNVWREAGEFGAARPEGAGGAGGKTGGTGVRYDELFVRHKDEWLDPDKTWTIGLAKLEKSASSEWTLGDIGGKPFWNVLKGTGLYSPNAWYTTALSATHLAIAALPPALPPALHTRQDIYLFPLQHSSTSTPPYPPTALPINLSAHYPHGEVQGVSFSKDGDKLVWLEMGEDGYEAGKRAVRVWDLKEGRSGERWAEGWELSPKVAKWSQDGQGIFVLAETKGRITPFYLCSSNANPIQLMSTGMAETLHVLDDHRLLVCKSTHTEPHNDWLITLPSTGGDEQLRSGKPGECRLTDWAGEYMQGRLDGIEPEEFWFEGDRERVMGWVVKPRGWEGLGERSVPMVFMIHGGPQSAWRDQWLIRWNPVLWAARGYFVLAINSTGSTGYGQDFVDRYRHDCAGAPVRDLELGYKAALQRFPQIDPERAAALGASSGGAVIHWINGHNDVFGFKALVSHAGIYDSTHQAYVTEELWLDQWDYGIDPNTDCIRDTRWNPADHINKWNIPTLISHGAQDHRVPDSNAIAALTALQWRGIPSRLLHFPDEAHKIEKQQNMKQWYVEVYDWLDQWVGRPGQPGPTGGAA
ncbi:hypothetical protein IAT38_002069 [Cryptococcus sp. DSM 104549]